MTEVDWERPRKYALVEHAERNAIYDAARYGNKTDGTTMVACWAACADCARAIVQAGITTLVRHYHPLDERWAESILIGDEILRSGGVHIIEYTKPIAQHLPVLFNGELWDPSKEENFGIHQ